MRPDDSHFEVVVAARTPVAEEVIAFDLVAPDGAALPEWLPGAHIDAVSDTGLTRQYSLCSDPVDRSRWRIAVLYEPQGRGSSVWLHERVGEGDRLSVRGPRNHFHLDPARRYIFVAGGIGITPIRTMIAAAERMGTPWQLHYAGRSRATMAFADQLQRSYPDRVFLYPKDQGRRIDLAAVLANPDRGTLVYSCGPQRLLAGIEAAGENWELGAIRAEHFLPKERGAPLRSGSFEVELRLSGKTVTVPADRSVLDVVTSAGVPVVSSCQEGTCGTCETTVLDGAIDHRDSVLTPVEQAAGELMMICVSRAAGPRLVLEL